MPAIAPMLDISHVTARYGAIEALRDVSLQVWQGELIALIGSNGAGKTTLMRSISGLVALARGSIRFNGTDLKTVQAYARAALGIGHVPEGRHVFGDQTVQQNLELGAYSRKATRAGVAADIERMLHLFPRLEGRIDQMAGTLSGGEQQMLAIARALMGRPSLLLLDEPSLGLAPLVVQEIFALIGALRSEGVTVLLVEQMANLALAVSDRGYVMETGAIVLEGPAAGLLSDARVREAYLGAAAADSC